MSLKLLLSYNIKPNREAEYYRFVLGEFLPELQSVGLLMDEGWHTAYGDYPIRLLVFRTQDGVEMTDIEDLQVASSDGTLIPLSVVADMRHERGYARIHRIDGRRTISLAVNA